MNLKKLFYLILLLSLTAWGCKFKVNDGLNWDQNLVAPILKSRLDLQHAFTDSALVQTNSDQSITIVFRDTLANISLADYLVVPDTSYAAKITLDSISLATDTITQYITMEQILAELCAQGQTIACNLTQGQFMPGLPAVNNLSGPPQSINAAQFFQEADLISGWMVVELENKLPMAIDVVEFNLRNDGTLQDTLVQKTMTNIAVNTTAKDSASLAGKTVQSMLAATLENITTAPAGPFFLDLYAYLRVRIIVHSLRASRATAVFPAQRVIDDYSRINYGFGNGIEITKIKSKTGHLILDAISTLQDTLAFTYGLPTAVKNGQSVLISDRLIPSINGAQAHIDLELDDYFIDLTLNGDSVNLFPYHLTGDLLYSGVLHTMDLNDSIDLNYGLVGIKPAYIEGYFGQNTFSFQDSIRFDFFRSILGGSLDLNAPVVTLGIVNSIGVDAELRIRQMDALNFRNNSVLSLAGSVVTNPTAIRGPQLPNVGQEVTTLIKLDNRNSNIRQFLSSLPDQIRFDLEVLVNKYGNPALRNNFATDASKLAAYLDVEIPLDGATNQLWLQDTVDLNLANASLPTSVEQSKLKLLCRNQFPLQAEVQIYFQDMSGTTFDSLFTTATRPILPAGTVNSSGYVDVPAAGELVAVFDQPRFVQLKQRGARGIVSLRLTTKPDGQPVKIYTTYGIDFHLVGDVSHRVGS